MSSLFAEEDGPYSILANFRHLCGEQYDKHSVPYIELRGDKWFHRLLYEFTEQLTCLWCCTIWVGLIWTLLWAIWPQGTFYVSIPFALSTVAVYINARGVRNRKRTTL